ncbi:MAG: hypothetical protein IJX78_00620 [Bacilli bacterium]|nr:hypothetical protein [Bacilli bacterium]
MRNICLLIKTYFLIFLGNLTGKKETKKILGGGLIVTLISLLMVGTFTITAITTTNQFLELSKVLPGAEEMAMFSNLTIGLLLVILFTIMRSIYPAKTSDEEMLLSLPVTKFQIIISKGFYNYLFDVASFGMVLLPSFIVYYVLIPTATFMVLVWGIIFVLLSALISNALSYFIGLIFINLASKFKNISIIQSVLTLICLAGYLILQYSIPGYLSDFEGDPILYINNIGIMKVLLSWILHNNLINFLVILALCIIPYLLTIIIRINLFGKTFNVYQNHDKSLKYHSSSVWYALFKKELKFYFGNSTYFINTIIGCFFVIGISVAYRIVGKEQVLAFVNVLPEELRLSPDILIVILQSMLLTTTVTTSVAISLEGKNLWILKVHPIRERDVFISKILVNITLSVVACLISGIMFMDFNKPFTGVAYFIIPALGSINSSIIGLLINLVFPKLEFDSVEQVVKRSISVPLSMAGAFIASLIPAVIYFCFGRNTWNLGIYTIVSIGVYLIIFFILTLILRTKGVKLYRKL